MSDFTIILRSLSARLFSTLTTILTVAVAVALLLTLISLRDAGGRAFERGTGNMHLLVSREASPLASVLNAVFYASAPSRALPYAERQRLLDNYPLDFAVPVQQGDSFRGHRVLATTPEFFTRFWPTPDRAWAFAAGDRFDGDFQVVLGSAVARDTGLTLGDRIALAHGMSDSRTGAYAEPDEHEHEEHEHDDHDHDGPGHVHREFLFTVVGILEPTGAAHDRALFISLDSAWIVHAHDRRLAADPDAGETTAADLTDPDRLITGLFVRVATRAGSSASAIMPQIASELRAQGFTVADPVREVQNLRAIVSNVDQILVAMAVAVLLSSGIAILLAMYNSMEQRRRQIAIFRVLGASRSRLFGLVLTESALLGIGGAILGVALSILTSAVAANILASRVGLVVDALPQPPKALGVVMFTIAVATISGLIPAAMAYRTHVANNLRPLG